VILVGPALEGALTGLHDEIAPALASLKAGERLLGLDLGTKTIGIALSDVERRIASPLQTIKRAKFTLDAQTLRGLVERFGVGAVVIGMPLNMDGSEGPRAQATRAFARNLRPVLQRPIVFWDERLSTLAVTRTLLQADASRARRQEVVDKMAAAYILQGMLDHAGRREAADEPDQD